MSRYRQEELDALRAVPIIARTTGVPILFMDPYDAGAIHSSKNLGMEFTKAHLALYELRAVDPEMPPLEEIPQDWNLQEGWGSGWEALQTPDCFAAGCGIPIWWRLSAGTAMR